MTNQTIDERCAIWSQDGFNAATWATETPYPRDCRGRMIPVIRVLVRNARNCADRIIAERTQESAEKFYCHDCDTLHARAD